MNDPVIKIERTSSTWINIKSYVERRIEELQRRLESDAAWDEVVASRARLKELRTFLESTQAELPLVEAEFEFEIPG